MIADENQEAVKVKVKLCRRQDRPCRRVTAGREVLKYFHPHAPFKIDIPTHKVPIIKTLRNMAQRSAGTAAPSGLRLVQRIPGKSLIVALPLPSSASVPQHSSLPNTFAVAAALPTHDRAFWMRFSYTPLVLKISTILRSLGLRQLNTGPGRILFKDSNVGKLADAVAEVIKRLPTTLEGLLDAASGYDYAPLHEETGLLLSRFGEEIWGAGKERPWLLQASDGHSEYQKDIIFGDAADHVV